MFGQLVIKCGEHLNKLNGDCSTSYVKDLKTT